MKLPASLKFESKEEKEEFEQDFQSCRSVREKLVEHFEKEIERLVIASEDPELYKLNNLSNAHSDNVGMRRGIRKVLNLLKEGL